MYGWSGMESKIANPTKPSLIPSRSDSEIDKSTDIDVISLTIPNNVPAPTLSPTETFIWPTTPSLGDLT